MTVNGNVSPFVSAFPADMGLPPEKSIRRRKNERRLINAALAIAAAASAAFYTVIFHDPGFLPKVDSATPSSSDLTVIEQMAACRFSDQALCLVVGNLVAVKTNGGNTGPAIEHPVVIDDHGVVKVVSRNLARNTNEALYVEWPVDEDLALCMGEEPLNARLMSLDPTLAASSQIPNYGTYSVNLNNLSEACKYRISNDLLPDLSHQAAALRHQ